MGRVRTMVFFLKKITKLEFYMVYLVLGCVQLCARDDNGRGEETQFQVANLNVGCLHLLYTPIYTFSPAASLVTKHVRLREPS